MDFAKKFYETGKYIIIVSRDKLRYFDYAIDAVKKINTRRVGKKLINTLEDYYSQRTDRVNPDIIITEDSAVGKSVRELATGRRV